MNVPIFVTGDHSGNRYIGTRADLVRHLGSARLAMAPIPSFYDMGKRGVGNLLKEAGAREVWFVNRHSKERLA